MTGKQWTPPNDAQEVEPSGMAEFWKPEAVGDTLIGRVHDIRAGQFGDYAHFKPVKVQPKGGDVQGYESLKLAINSWLNKLVRLEHKGQYLAVVYSGTRGTPAGKMRTFRVFYLTPEQAGDFPAEPPREPGEEGEDDDLPF